MLIRYGSKWHRIPEQIALTRQKHQNTIKSKNEKELKEWKEKIKNA